MRNWIIRRGFYLNLIYLYFVLCSRNLYFLFSYLYYTIWLVRKWFIRMFITLFYTCGSDCHVTIVTTNTWLIEFNKCPFFIHFRSQHHVSIPCGLFRGGGCSLEIILWSLERIFYTRNEGIKVIWRKGLEETLDLL